MRWAVVGLDDTGGDTAAIVNTEIDANAIGKKRNMTTSSQRESL
jgi:hypothetical protein